MEILASLQKPKKITLKGSDGKSYIMMCKPKDDLRKDCRLMEFNSLINKVWWVIQSDAHTYWPEQNAELSNEKNQLALR